MYTTIESFIKDWNEGSNATIKILCNLTDESLSQPVVPGGRTLGFIAWHITTAIGEMLNKVGLNTDSPSENSPMPSKAQEIAEAYKKAAKSLLPEIQNKWNDAKLVEESNMYGQMWKNGFTLAILVVHEIHHRGQMTVLMRQAGLKVPGVCGPSKEEWEAMGMAPLK